MYIPFLIILALDIITCHLPNGQEIDINAHEISSVRDVRADADHHFAKGTKCLVTMTNGHINTVTEDCDVVRLMLKAISGNNGK